MFTKNNSFAARIFKMILVFAVAMASIVPIQVHAMPQAVINTAGALDITFDSDGLVTTSIGSFSDSARAIALQPDGKLVITGNFSENFNQGWNNFFLARYNSDGSLDNTFDLDGKVTGFWGNESAAGTLAIQNDGKIIIAGYTSTSSFNEAELALARFNSDGSLDTSFDTDGKVITNLGSGYDYASDVVIQADGKIVVAGVRQIGANDNDIVLLRYNTNGSLDSSFNTDGIVSTSVGNIDFAGSIVIQPDGKFVVGGSTDKNGDQLDFNLLRYNTDGSLDSSFGTAGIVITDFGIGGSSDQGGFIALQPDGKTIAAGFNLDGYFLLARYNTDGSLDRTFDSDGLVSTYSSNAIIQGLALQSNGKIVIAGSSGPNNDFAIVRYSDNGSLDMSLDGDGMVFTDFGVNKNDQARAVIVQPDGKIVAAGDRDGSSNYDIALARYIGDEPPQTRYVRLGASGDNNGTSWANAYTDLQSAIAAASSGDEIWVAAGTYKPTANKDRSISFALKNGVKIYGGFAGTETSLAQRNPTTNVTILSGDIGIQADNSDNSYHVLVGSSTNNSAILDGFTVTDGNANGEMYPSYQADGGGMFNFIGSPSLANVIFSENSALFAGGGMYNLGDSFNYPNGSSPILTNVVFSGNSATEGGGMRNENYSNPILTNVAFSNNTAERSGGGMENFYHSSPTLINITFSGNTSAGGGAIMNWSSSSPSLTNVTFNANSATDEGGGIYNDSGSNPSLNNVTFSGNTANQGGGLYNASGSNPVTVNSIFYGNSGVQIYDESDTKSVTHSIVQGGYTGIGNLDADPLLISLANNGGFTRTMALGTGSPAIDAGTNAGCPETDQRGVPRPQNGQCDIGAYEVTPPMTLYVKWDSSGANDGSSWINAYTDLQTALAFASSGDEIWVAAGTYKPTTGTDRSVSFALENGVAIYGGFAGNEVSFTQRDPAANVTILSGDIGVTGNNSDNSYHVAIGSSTNNSAILNGFTITAGNANTDMSYQTGGGGIFNYIGSPSLTNLKIVENYGYWGGGMYNLGEAIFLPNEGMGSNPILTNIVFSDNSASEGGGMRNEFHSNPILTNVVFRNNTASRASGGMHNGTYSSPTLTNGLFEGNVGGLGPGGLGNFVSNAVLTNVTFKDNTATMFGGGVVNNSGIQTFTNVTFSGNSAEFGGGMWNSDTSPTLTNVTFKNNSASTAGGGIYSEDNTTMVVRNTILWGNTAPTSPQIHNDNSAATVSDSVVQGGFAGGTNIITVDPLLSTLANNGGFTETMALGVGSSAINAGTNAGCPETDQRGVPRPQGAKCDIGAYEVTPPTTRYVKWDSSGANDGSSWINAYTDLQTALAFASSGDEIWVAAGTYRPTAGTDRTISFNLKNGVAIYGGFAGTETLRTQRDPTINVTTLSGDIGVVDDSSDNSYHVMVGSGTDNSAILDGFMITAGNANGASSYSGGGMYNEGNSAPQLRCVIFRDNLAVIGAGMFNNISNPVLTNVIFDGNISSGSGGGMFNYQSSPTLVNVIFNSNNGAETSRGGAMVNDTNSSPHLTNVTFAGNRVTYTGGAMLNVDNSNPILENVTFYDNTSMDRGGAIYNWASSPILKNVTFSGNNAPIGGAIYNDNNSNPTVVNTILYGDGGGEIYNNSGTATVTYSIVQGGYSGTGNLDTDPLLQPLANNGGFTKTMALGTGSPAIDAGTNTDCPSTDQRGVSRPQGGICDIGAYEYRSDATFSDVPLNHWAWIYIEGLYSAGVTSGCSLSPLMFCPTTTVTRDQMAVFLLKAKYGSGHIPPAPTGVFQDVPTDYWAAPWIEELAAEGITSGCSVSPKLYCPTTTVTRDQMAVFLLKAKHGSGYTPPTPTGVFEDVPTDYWAASWIERLAAEGITGGCSVTPKLYCPATPVSRDQMAIFLDKTFGIPLP